MFDSNPLCFYTGPEAIKVNRLKDLSNSTEALLAAGVIETDAYNEAKYTLELKVLYELIEELSWY